MYEPTLKQFKELAAQGNLIPVRQVIMADLDTPLSAFLKIAENDPHAFLLESVEQGEKLGRYSFIGANPSRIFRCREFTLLEEADGQVTEHALGNGVNPLDVMQQFMSQFQAVPVEGMPPFVGGLVGYLSYEMTRHFENLEFNNRDDYNIPESVFYFCDTVIAFDHFQRTMSVITNAMINGNVEDAYQKAIERIDAIVQCLKKPLDRLPFGAGSDTELDVRTNWSKEDFQDAVDQSMEFIKAGDIFQIQVGIRKEVDLQCTPMDLYRALRRINPSPYTFFFRHDNLCLIGGSPEILVKMTNKNVIYRPIAGTRRRGATHEEDLFMEKELINDPKEQAEHIMLVDLGRNDIGRVCKFHSVKVDNDDLMFIERYSHVMHLVSTVFGELCEDKNAYDLMGAVFPAGTVTGAPKIRSMEIIEDLERTQRGPYAGAVGWFGFSGDMDFCITLRTITVVDDKAYFQASAGIVADSDRDLEFLEVTNKSKAMLSAIQLAHTIQD